MNFANWLENKEFTEINEEIDVIWDNILKQTALKEEVANESGTEQQWNMTFSKLFGLEKNWYKIAQNAARWFAGQNKNLRPEDFYSIVNDSLTNIYMCLSQRTSIGMEGNIGSCGPTLKRGMILLKGKNRNTKGNLRLAPSWEGQFISWFNTAVTHQARKKWSELQKTKRPNMGQGWRSDIKPVAYDSYDEYEPEAEYDPHQIKPPQSSHLPDPESLDTEEPDFDMAKDKTRMDKKLPEKTSLYKQILKQLNIMASQAKRADGATLIQDAKKVLPIRLKYPDVDHATFIKRTKLNPSRAGRALNIIRQASSMALAAIGNSPAGKNIRYRDDKYKKPARIAAAGTETPILKRRGI